MTFLWLLLVIVVFIGLFALWQWWCDEREKAGKVVRYSVPGSHEDVIPTVTSPATPLHPSVDPYLADLRAYLLEEPLPRGPGDMASQVYAHLNQWLNGQVDPNVTYEDEYDFTEVPTLEDKPYES